MFVSFNITYDTIIVSLCQENILFFLNFYWNKNFTLMKDLNLCYVIMVQKIIRG